MDREISESEALLNERTSDQAVLESDLQEESDINNQNGHIPRGTKNNVLLFWKDLLFMSVSYTLIFISFMALQNLESSLNNNAGLGVASLACIYGGVVIVCLVAPVCVRYVGCKGSIIICFVTQTIFTVTNAYPRFYTLVPSSLLIGISSAVMWTAQGSYLTILSSDYATVKGVSFNQVLSQFNGIFFFFFQSSQIWGNLISSLTLSHEAHTSNHTEQCGFKFCDLSQANKTKESSDGEQKELIYILIGTFAACDIIGILIVSFLVSNRPLPESSHEISTKENVFSTLKIHSNKHMLMLLPLFLSNGVEQAYLLGEYTKAFPGCFLGVGKIGYVMISFGVSNSILSVIVGRLEKLVGRPFLFTLAFLIDVSMILTMMFWKPSAGNEFLFYLIPAVWGIGDSIWQTTSCAFIGVIFNKNMEPAFATFRLWQALGFVVIFAVSHYICMDIKTYFILGLLTVSMILYYAVEIDIRKIHTVKYSPIN